MTSKTFQSILSKDNPSCVRQALPPWLLHDLLQPLNAYGLVSEQFRDSIQLVLAEDDSLSVDWKIMSSAIQTQERLLRSLRQFWYLQSTQPPLEKRPIKLAPIAQKLKAQHEAEFPGIHIQVHGFESLCVSSQSDRLADLLAPLLKNAATYARTTVTLIAYETAAGVRIEVIDDGFGLPHGVIDSLGMPFLRHPSNQPAKHPGLGLGVYLAVKNAELLGHAFDVSSEPGIGCHFSVTVPAAATDTEHFTSMGDVDPLLGACIQVMDSDERHGRALQQLFASWGCRADFAPDGNRLSSSYTDQGGADILLVSCDIWSSKYAEIRDVTNSGSLPPPEILIVVNDKHAPTIAVLAEIANDNRLHVLRRPLSPSRLRSSIVFALRSRGGKASPQNELTNTPRQT